MKQFPRTVLVSIIFLFSFFSFSLTIYGGTNISSKNPEDKKILTILNWSEYMDPELIEKFEGKYGVKVKESYFSTDDLRDEKLLTTHGSGYDLVICSGPSIDIYTKINWLTPLTESDIPNLKYIDGKWFKAFPFAEGYGVPYFWGTTGIAYRKDKLSTPVKSWKQLFQPAESLRGKIIMIKTSRDLIGMALKALGYSANSVDKKELTEAEKVLLEQKPFVLSYSYLSLSKDSALVTGDAWMAMLYSGDAIMLQEHCPDITYVVPEEGGSLWVDYLVILQSSQNKEVAKKFINFLNEPEHAARLAQYVYYATPNKAAEKRLSHDFLADPVIYPPKEVIEKSEPYTILPAEAMKVRNRISTFIMK